VELLDADGNVVETATTDGEGQYLFEGVECAEYQVRFTLPEDSGFEFTEPGVGDDPAVDSNPESTDDPLVGVTPSFEVTPEDPEDLTIDAGVVAPVPPPGECTVGDTVWIDQDADGVQGDGEPGVPGVTVELLDADGTVVGSGVTAPDGAYLVEGVECAEYQVRFTVPEDGGYEFTEPGVGDDPVVDSNPESTDDALVGVTPSFEVTPEDPEDLTIDAGVIAPTCTVGDYVWLDEDADGVQGDDEPGLEGVTVELLDADGNVVETVTTDGEGQYLFEGVECAEYQVRFTLPEDGGYEFTEPGVGDDPVVDSNPEPTDDPLVGVTPSF